MIGSLLIANRGEIAVRIMRTCRRLGIRTVAVFSDADRDAQHVAFADEAVRIGPAAARDSYLRAEAIMEAAARSGAEAIHPGYGFLSEKPDLSLLCRQAGRIFVGPSAECITAMGPKIGSKLIAEKAGVSSVPGYAGDDQSNAALVDAAARIGYPVMIKASAGGGGKGMRRVFAAEELVPAVEIARAEAQAAFGDPALLIEKLVMRPRHLEVQVAGDKHGHVVHLFERDCSVQRNNQKVLEEAPAPNLDPAIRAKLLERGVALAKAISYDNLGTVEFILEDGFDEPWFLEMNTRLQVEHPVTEAITGYDLVEWQIRIAAGERLPALQHEIRESGHAIEARITAERADQGFRPDTGRIEGYAEPASIRVDSGVQAGSEVTLFYDSLLAKAIAAGPDRATACARLAAGLRDFAILGPATTLPFLIDAVEHPLFAQGKATTRFIEDAFPDGWTAKRPRQRLARAVAALLWLEKQGTARSGIDTWNSLAGFRLLAPAGGVATSRVIAEEEDGATKLEIRLLPGDRRVVIDGDGVIELALRIHAERFELSFEDRLLRGSHATSEGRVRLTLDGENFDIGIGSEARPAAAAGGGGAGSGAVLAPMPGVVAEVRVGPGDRVEAGQVVIVLESMKLFTSLSAGVGGVVTEVSCQPGDTVQAGKRLALIETSTSSS